MANWAERHDVDDAPVDQRRVDWYDSPPVTTGMHTNTEPSDDASTGTMANHRGEDVDADRPEPSGRSDHDADGGSAYTRAEEAPPGTMAAYKRKQAEDADE